jgi:cardiolipin synthase
MLEAIAIAEHSVYLEMYILLDDTKTTHDFFGLLNEKARNGVEVVVIADAFGSHALSAKTVAELRSAGGEFLFFSHWLRRSHRKVLIIDNKTAFVGGVNIEEKTRDWRDLSLRLKGRIIKPIIKSFAYSYKMAGGKKTTLLQYNNVSLTKKIKSWFVDNWSNSQHSYYLDSYYRTKILEAKRSIRIVTPYLIPPRWLLALLDDAIRRGVAVEIIMPHNTDHRILNRINYFNAYRLTGLGAHCYFMPLMNHAKMMLVDSEEGVVGSQNFDFLSFGVNAEAGVFFRQKDLIASLEHLLDRWKKGAQLQVFTKKRKISWKDHLVIFFMKFFYHIF